MLFITLLKNPVLKILCLSIFPGEHQSVAKRLKNFVIVNMFFTNHNTSTKISQKGNVKIMLL